MQQVTVANTGKSVVNELYQKYNGTPVFGVEQDSNLTGSTFTGTVELPGIPGCFERAKFTGKGQSKKAAEQAAAENALEYVREKAPGLLLSLRRFSAQKIPLSQAAQSESNLEDLNAVAKNLNNFQDHTQDAALIQARPGNWRSTMKQASSASSDSSADMRLTAEPQAIDLENFDKQQLINRLYTQDNEIKSLRQALVKERNLRQQVATLLASQPSGFL